MTKIPYQVNKTATKLHLEVKGRNTFMTWYNAFQITGFTIVLIGLIFLLEIYLLKTLADGLSRSPVILIIEILLIELLLVILTFINLKTGLYRLSYPIVGKEVIIIDKVKETITYYKQSFKKFEKKIYPFDSIIFFGILDKNKRKVFKKILGTGNRSSKGVYDDAVCYLQVAPKSKKHPKIKLLIGTATIQQEAIAFGQKIEKFLNTPIS